MFIRTLKLSNNVRSQYLDFQPPSKGGGTIPFGVPSAVGISTDFMGESKANKANIGDERSPHPSQKMTYFSHFSGTLRLAMQIKMMTLFLRILPGYD